MWHHLSHQKQQEFYFFYTKCWSESWLTLWHFTLRFTSKVKLKHWDLKSNMSSNSANRIPQMLMDSEINHRVLKASFWPVNVTSLKYFEFTRFVIFSHWFLLILGQSHCVCWSTPHSNPAEWLISGHSIKKYYLYCVMMFTALRAAL